MNKEEIEQEIERLESFGNVYIRKIDNLKRKLKRMKDIEE